MCAGALHAAENREAARTQTHTHADQVIHSKHCYRKSVTAIYDAPRILLCVYDERNYGRIKIAFWCWQ